MPIRISGTPTVNASIAVAIGSTPIIAQDGERGGHGELPGARRTRLAQRIGQRDGHGMHGQGASEHDALDDVCRRDGSHDTLPGALGLTACM